MKRLLAVVNTENAKHPTIDLALNLLRSAGGILDIVTTMPRMSPILLSMWSSQDRAFEQEFFTDKQLRLSEIVSSLEVENITTNSYVLQGKSFVEIIALANKNRVDMVLSDDTIDLEESKATVQGPTNFQLLRRCLQPVWLLNSVRPTIPAKVVAAIDVEDTHLENMQLNTKILLKALELSKQFGAQLEVVHAWDLLGESIIVRKLGIEEADRERRVYTERILAAAEFQLQSLRERNASYEFRLVNGAPEMAIPAFLDRRNADLMVVGTVGRSGIPGLLMGNTSEKILRTAKSSILALKPDGFLTVGL